MLDLIKSPRFQGILVIGLLQALVLFNVITGVQGDGLVLIIQGIIAAAIANKTIDKIGEKKVESAKIVSGMSPSEAKIV